MEQVDDRVGDVGVRFVEVARRQDDGGRAGSAGAGGEVEDELVRAHTAGPDVEADAVGDHATIAARPTVAHPGHHADEPRDDLHWRAHMPAVALDERALGGVRVAVANVHVLADLTPVDAGVIEGGGAVVTERGVRVE